MSGDIKSNLSFPCPSRQVQHFTKINLSILRRLLKMRSRRAVINTTPMPLIVIVDAVSASLVQNIHITTFPRQLALHQAGYRRREKGRGVGGVDLHNRRLACPVGFPCLRKSPVLCSALALVQSQQMELGLGQGSVWILASASATEGRFLLSRQQPAEPAPGGQLVAVPLHQALANASAVAEGEH